MDFFSNKDFSFCPPLFEIKLAACFHILVMFMFFISFLLALCPNISYSGLEGWMMMLLQTRHHPPPNSRPGQEKTGGKRGHQTPLAILSNSPQLCDCFQLSMHGRVHTKKRVSLWFFFNQNLDDLKNHYFEMAANIKKKKTGK